jgi:hypothetical protein
MIALKIIYKSFFATFLVLLMVACGNDRRGQEFSSDYHKSNFASLEDTESDQYEEELPFPDGAYEATVYYVNSETDYSATYTLEVEVESNEVTVIYFPNDGWLDDDHIWPDALDDSGYVYIEGEDGKSYEIQIN